MNARQYLKIVGIILVLVAVLGFIGIIGPTSAQSIFGRFWYFDNGENWAHLILGIVALVVGFGMTSMVLQKWAVIIVGIVAILVGIIGFFLGGMAPNFLGANLENPADNLLHLILGIWALWAAMNKDDMMEINM